MRSSRVRRTRPTCLRFLIFESPSARARAGEGQGETPLAPPARFRARCVGRFAEQGARNTQRINGEHLDKFARLHHAASGMDPAINFCAAKAICRLAA